MTFEKKAARCWGISLVVLLSASLAGAEIAISFASGTGTLTDNGGGDLATHSLFLVYSSPDVSSSGFNPLDLGNPSGGDSFLGAFDTTAGPPLGGRITGYDSQVLGSGSPGLGGGDNSLYIAVFDYAFSSYTGPGAIPLGTYYGVGYVLNPLTERFGVLPAPTADNYGAGLTLQTSQLVPEPGTWALFALGAVLVGAHVRRRKS